MTTSEMIALIRGRLHRPNAADADILAEIQAAQREFEQRAQLPWFLVTVTYLTTTLGTRAVSVPTNFLREQEEAISLQYIPSGTDTVPLLKEEFDVLETAYGTSSGSPQAYALKGNIFYMFPIPDAVYSLRLWYYAAEPVLDTTNQLTNAWSINVPDLLVGKAGLAVALLFRDFDAVKIFDKMYQQAFGMLLATHYQRKEAGRRVSMGEGI